MHAAHVSGPMAGLPNPETDAEFYRGVPFRRFVAWVIDLIVVLAIGVPLALVFGVFTLGFGFALFPAILTAIAFGYRTLTLANASATWGMQFCGIEFRRGDGTRFDLTTAVLHTLIQTVAFAFFVLQLLSCVTILATRYGQSLADLILGTTALHRAVD
jgi:uncharacterized RDD family membrane protein YckC